MRDSPDEITICRGEAPVGVLSRTALGCRFQYHPDAAFPDPPAGIAFSMPFREDPYEITGVNLHPFFANLLPEGLRFQALAGRVGTSIEDLFGIFQAVGADTVGDVWPLSEDASNDEPWPEDFAQIAKDARLQAHSAPLAGVQPKLSDQRIALLNKGRNAILKLAPPAFPNLVANEQACLNLARGAGLDVVESSPIQDAHGTQGLLVTRFDRVSFRGKVKARVHVEDGCQLCDRYPADKYRLSLRNLMERVVEASSSGPREALRLLQLYAFSYLIGNADLHAKNVSIWLNPKQGVVELSPTYDLVCTLVFAGLETRMAMRMDAKDDRLRRSDFVEFGARFGLNERAVVAVLNRLLDSTHGWSERVRDFAPSEADFERTRRALVERRALLQTV